MTPRTHFAALTLVVVLILTTGCNPVSATPTITINSPTPSPTASTVPPSTPIPAQSTATVNSITTTPPPICSGPPVITSFSISPNIMSAGNSATLTWGAVNSATSVVIDQDIGGVAAPGSIVVTPSATTTYTMTATGCGGTATKAVTITVNPVYAIPVGVKAFQGPANPANSNQVKVWVHVQTSGPVSTIEVFVASVGSFTCNNTAACDYQLGYRDFGFAFSYWAKVTNAGTTVETVHENFTVVR